MVVPMPATWAPDRVIASICQAADPLSPPDWYGFQLAPVADAHRATACWPGWPDTPAAMKPVAAAVSAVNEVSGPGELNGTCCQVTPPSVDSDLLERPDRGTGGRGHDDCIPGAAVGGDPRVLLSVEGAHRDEPVRGSG